MTMNKFLMITVYIAVVIVAFVLGGINAIPIEGINEPIELQVQPVSSVPLYEPQDLQHAGGYRLLENSYNPQWQNSDI